MRSPRPELWTRLLGFVLGRTLSAGEWELESVHDAFVQGPLSSLLFFVLGAAGERPAEGVGNYLTKQLQALTPAAHEDHGGPTAPGGVAG